MTLRAGDGLNLNFDGSQIEISLARPDWFVAEITSRTTPASGGGCPTVYGWKKMTVAKDGCTWETENPGLSGDGKLNPAYLVGASSALVPVGTKVIMRQRPGGSSSNYGPTFEFISAGTTTSSSSGSGSGSGGSGSGGSGSGSGQCFDVIQSITCTNGGLQVTYATICPDSGTAVVVGQQMATTQ